MLEPFCRIHADARNFRARGLTRPDPQCFITRRARRPISLCQRVPARALARTNTSIFSVGEARYTAAMRRAFIACLVSLPFVIVQPLAAEPPSAALASAATSKYPCDQPTCGMPSLARTPTYSQQIERGGDFSAEVSINQPCSCSRRLGVLMTFTALGAKTAREHLFKLDIAGGTSSTKLVLSKADLAKARITPGHYTISFGLYDEHEKLAGSAQPGNPFTLGTSQPALVAKPVIPETISRDSELSVPFAFSNDGDIPARVTALLVFTRPDSSQGIELYVPNLIVPPRGAKHVVHVGLAKRKELAVGAGAWLVTSSAFDDAENRLASFPGHLLMIGKVLSQPVPPTLTSPIEQTQEVSVTLSLKNDGDVDDLVTALLIFSGPGAAKPIEYKLEGIHLAPGLTTHPVILSALDRYNLGLRPGRWKVSATALDRAGKRLETRRATDLVINPEPSASAAK
jgi:hypothetical protein